MPDDLWDVPIVYKGQCNYVVRASSAKEAEEIARNKFNSGEMPGPLGNEWERIEYVGEVERTR